MLKSSLKVAYKWLKSGSKLAHKSSGLKWLLASPKRKKKLTLRWAPHHTEVSRALRAECEKSPKRVRTEHPEREHPGVSKDSEKSLKPRFGFQTLFGVT